MQCDPKALFYNFFSVKNNHFSSEHNNTTLNLVAGIPNPFYLTAHLNKIFFVAFVIVGLASWPRLFRTRNG